VFHAKRTLPRINSSAMKSELSGLLSSRRDIGCDVSFVLKNRVMVLDVDGSGVTS
jgi:hypothetical protein